jgi:UDP-N-acetylmuramate--alanine ligase
LGECQFSSGKALVVDDYGHHPNEINATVEALRLVWPNKRLVHVFQPHRYTRTKDLFSQFVEVLGMADELLLLDIYSAGENPIPGISSDMLRKTIAANPAKRVHLITERNLREHLENVIREGDVILMQGAGNVGQMAMQLMGMT